MSKNTFNINNDDVVELTNRLEKTHKSAMPVAVRGALNDAAFDMKKNRLEKVFQAKFTIRKKTFIRAHTVANKSKNTFNINEMKSEVGVIKGKSDSGDELINQEMGGTIGNRTSIAMDPARVGKNKTKAISKRHYLKAVKAKKTNNLVRGAFKAGKGGYLLYRSTIFQVKSLKKTKRVPKIRLAAIYSYEKGRSVRIKKSPFLTPAAEISAKLIPDFFIKRAKAKLMKK